MLNSQLVSHSRQKKEGLSKICLDTYYIQATGRLGDICNITVVFYCESRPSDIALYTLPRRRATGSC